MKVTKIYHPGKHREARQKVLRVAAYCRVSTKQEEQESSYEEQMTVYTEKINSQEGWQLAGIYADRGISGTSAKKRPEFLRLIRDCERSLIDVVICKSLSRFARHTREALFYFRHLQSLGVRLIFEKEDIDTESSYSEMMMTILAAFAEEESRSISENSKWGSRRRAQEGEKRLVRLYGYRKADDNYEIVPEEAEIVRKIFDCYEHGVSTMEIARTLTETGAPRLKTQQDWDDTRIRRIIENEKYAGDYKTQKYYSKDVLDRRHYKNDGVLPSVYIVNSHEAIIPRKQFERCSQILNMRKKGTALQYPFGEYLRCPYCGCVLSFRKIVKGRAFCCENDACKGFVIGAVLVEKTILKAYNSIDTEMIRKQADAKAEDAEEENKMLRIKEEFPAFEKVDFWWLDELVKEIRIGRHTYTYSELKKMGKLASDDDDRTITVHWKSGLLSKLPSGVIRDAQDPKKRAESWNQYFHKDADLYPEPSESTVNTVSED